MLGSFVALRRRCSLQLCSCCDRTDTHVAHTHEALLSLCATSAFFVSLHRLKQKSHLLHQLDLNKRGNAMQYNFHYAMLQSHNNIQEVGIDFSQIREGIFGLICLKTDCHGTLTQKRGNHSSLAFLGYRTSSRKVKTKQK